MGCSIRSPSLGANGAFWSAHGRIWRPRRYFRISTLVMMIESALSLVLVVYRSSFRLWMSSGHCVYQEWVKIRRCFHMWHTVNLDALLLNSLIAIFADSLGGSHSIAKKL